ncbi:MAG: MmpS family transport accessory protein [Mycobacterium sp.]
MIKRIWIPLVIAFLLVVAGFAVLRLHGAFGTQQIGAPLTARVDDIMPFNPKRVTLEVFGPPGTIADINYLDVAAVPRQVDATRLPWTYSVTTTAPAVSVNVVAQGDSQVIGCRIIVNDNVKDERTVQGTNAQTFCLVKSA